MRFTNRREWDRWSDYEHRPQTTDDRWRRTAVRGRPVKALLLAAGEGTRLRPLTDTMPKPMIPIAGKPILQHNVEWLDRFGIREIAINLHHCPKVVTDHFGDGARFGVNITYSYEPTLLGTAGAVKKLESFFQGAAFLVVYGDNLIHCELHRLLEFHRRYAGIATVAVHYRDDVTQSGVVALDAQDRITRFVEKPQASQTLSHWVNAGILVLEPRVLEYVPSDVASDFGGEILPLLLERAERLYAYRFGDGESIRWIDTPQDLERAVEIGPMA